MWLNNSQRARLLAKKLLRRPWLLPSWLGHLPFWGRRPADLGLPWWSYGAIREVGSRLGPQSEVFELGTGGSTIFFAERARSVAAVEDAAWRENVEPRLRARGLNNCTIHSAPLPSPDAADPRWESSLARLDRPCDLIVVAGQDTPTFGEEREIRTCCFFAAEPHVRPGGMIVVDDSWRHPQLRTQAKAQRFQTFQDVGPAGSASRARTSAITDRRSA